MKTLHRFTLVLTLMGLGAIAASADTLWINSGGLTLTGIVNPSFNFLGLDFRGTVALNTPDGTVLLTDNFASPAFGNTTLIAINPTFDGTGVQVDFQLPSFLLSGGGSVFQILSTGIIAAGPLSAPEADMLQTLLYTFNLTGVQPVVGTPNFQATYVLAQVDSTAPEPATIGLGAIGLGIAAIAAKRRKQLSS
jgi:hypothetical protein